ncbi:MAG: rod shape-determining protein [Acidimicrobiales bacterium]
MAIDVVLDIGTQNVVACIPGKGVVFREPSLVVYDVATKSVVAIGEKGLSVLSEIPGSLAATKPVEGGAVADIGALGSLAGLVLKSCGASRLSKPRVLVCISPSASSLEKRAVRDALRHAGASSVRFVPQAVAVSISAGISINDAAGAMVVDVGAGKTCASAVSLGGIIDYEEVRIGGDYMDRAIRSFLRQDRGVMVSSRVAGEIRLMIGSAAGNPVHDAVEVMGRDASGGQQVTLVVKSGEIYPVCREALDSIFDTVVRCITKIPPELAYDLTARGVMLVGGVARMKDLAEWMSGRMDLAVAVPEDPQTCIAEGGAKLLQITDHAKGLFEEVTMQCE